MCENYLVLVHEEDILHILADSDKNKYFSVNINFLELFESDTNLGNALLTDPENSFKNWNEAVLNVQNNLIKEVDRKYTIKNNVNCRIYSLPPWPHVCRTIFPGNDDADKFLQVTGTVVRMTARKLLEYQRQYVCTKCKFPITVEANYDKRNIIKQPKKCSNPEGCTGKNIITFGELDSYNCKDYQEIKIQEDLSKMSVGTIPGHMVVTLEDDLVNACKPGENITITGIVKRRWSEFDKGVKIIVDIVLKANHIQVNNSSGLSIAVSDDMRQFFDSFWMKYRHDPLVGRNVILKSISPEIYGRQLVKLAMAIVLAGGSPSEESQISTGIDTRSESHLLLVGDPGTGKSQMLRFASRIIPRSVLTTGVGSTAAGLTVTAIMENGEWQLEAGALVMADGGICCIDEFNSMREHDRTSIHEAMEQQTISVAKAGMVCKLKTRCSILAACNPKGNIDPSQPLCVNVAMSSPLLSRFDLILLLRDIVNEDNDRKLADYLLNKSSELSGDGVFWSLEKLQAYYAVIKKESPKLTAESETILSTYYQLQRKFGSRNKSRTTVRLLESLIRLSQGHAKLIFHHDVEVIDTIFAIILVDAALDYESSLLNLNIDYDSFFDNPQQMYWDLLENILGKLNLDYIYQREVEKMGIIIKKSSQNTNVSQTEDDMRSHSGDYRILTQDLVTGTPKRTTLLFSQRAQSQKERVINSQHANQCDNQNTEQIDVHEASINNKSQFLFSQRRQKICQNMCENDLNPNRSQTTTEIVNLNNMISTQNGPKLLFTQKRSTQKVQQNSIRPSNNSKEGFSQKITEQNQDSLSHLLTDANSKVNTDPYNISTDSDNINYSSQHIMKNTFNHNPPSFTKDRTSNQKFSIYQKKNDSFMRDTVAYHFEKGSSSKPTEGSEQEDYLRGEPFKNSKKNPEKSVFRKSNNDELKVCGMDKRNMTLSDIVKSNSAMDFDFDYCFKNINMTNTKHGNQNIKNVEYCNDLPSFNEKYKESGYRSEMKSNKNSKIKESILEQPNINLTQESSRSNCESNAKENKPNKSGDTLKKGQKGKLNDSIKSAKTLKKHEKKITNNIDLLSFMPSINDDFVKYGLNIDWDMQEYNKPSCSEHESDISQRKGDNFEHFGKKRTDILKSSDKLNASDDLTKEQKASDSVAKKIGKNDENKFLNKSIGKSSKLSENEKEKRVAPQVRSVDLLANFQFIPKEQREKVDEVNKTGNESRNRNNNEGSVKDKGKANNEADIIESSQNAPKPLKKFKMNNPSFIISTKSDNNISSDYQNGKSNDSISGATKLETKKATVNFKRLVSEIDLDEEIRNFKFKSTIQNPFGKSLSNVSSKPSSNASFENEKNYDNDRQVDKIECVAGKGTANTSKSNFGNLDMNIEQFDLELPINVSKSKHELFDMTQNSRNKYIRNQFSFKKLDIKRMASSSSSRSNSDEL